MSPCGPGGGSGGRGWGAVCTEMQELTLHIVLIGLTFAAFSNSLHGQWVFDDLPGVSLSPPKNVALVHQQKQPECLVDPTSKQYCADAVLTDHIAHISFFLEQPTKPNLMSSVHAWIEGGGRLPFITIASWLIALCAVCRCGRTRI